MAGPIFVYLETDSGKVRKSSLEAVSYARRMADTNHSRVYAVAFGTKLTNHEKTGNAGADVLIHINMPVFDQGNTNLIANALAVILNKYEADSIVIAKSSMSDSLAAKISVKLNGALFTNVTELPLGYNPITIKRSIFGGKAFETVSSKKEKYVICIAKNACEMVSVDKTPELVEIADLEVDERNIDAKLNMTEKKTTGILLTEASKVVSAGRGLKGPENWGMIEDLAVELGAATACSKPVSDIGWRPHSEHVGQTGLKIAPDLYIAIGISGAIQHLAGVYSSRIIVVINKDPEAPFFKSADYGIVGDAFEVVPKLTEELRKSK